MSLAIPSWKDEAAGVRASECVPDCGTGRMEGSTADADNIIAVIIIVGGPAEIGNEHGSSPHPCVLSSHPRRLLGYFFRDGPGVPWWPLFPGTLFTYRSSKHIRIVIIGILDTMAYNPRIRRQLTNIN